MRRNVFVIFLDTVRRDQLRLDGEPGANFLERKMLDGALLENHIVAGNSTRISVNAVFNGFFGATTGLNFHWGCDAAFRASRVPGLADIFHHHGHRTLAISQGDEYLPGWGFDAFHANQASIDTGFLRAWLQEGPEPAFVYLHFSELHDEAFGRPERMTAANYRRAWDALAREVQGVWEACIGPEDVVVLVSDHGCNLRAGHDPHWRFHHEEEPTGGIFLGEATVRGIGSLIGKDVFPACRLPGLTRSVDIFPTLLDALGLPRPPVQGKSLLPVIVGRESHPHLTAYAETGGQTRANGQSPSRMVRDENWKFVRYDVWGEELYDLRHDPHCRENLVGRGLAAEERLRRLFSAQVAENRRGPWPFLDREGDLVAAVLADRGPWPETVRGPRGSCFAGMVDDEVRALLGATARRMLPRWLADGERVALYSASEHTAAFLADGSLVAAGVVVGVIDGNPRLAGETFCGAPVCTPEAYEEVLRPTLVVVAHYFFANDMYVRIKEHSSRPVPVRNVYRLEQEIPLWWDEPVPVEGACR